MGENTKAVPRHVAIILDGNGRWAKKRMLPRNAGHAAGSKNVEKICEAAWNMGIEYVTMYAFSTENWSRPQEEVDALMKLLHSYLKDCIKTSKKNNMQALQTLFSLRMRRFCFRYYIISIPPGAGAAG